MLTFGFIGQESWYYSIYHFVKNTSPMTMSNKEQIKAYLFSISTIFAFQISSFFTRFSLSCRHKQYKHLQEDFNAEAYGMVITYISYYSEKEIPDHGLQLTSSRNFFSLLHLSILDWIFCCLRLTAFWTAMEIFLSVSSFTSCNKDSKYYNWNRLRYLMLIQARGNLGRFTATVKCYTLTNFWFSSWVASKSLYSLTIY